MLASALLSLALAATTRAHTAAWAAGMYCKGGNVSDVDDNNTNNAVNPMYMMTQDQWMFQHYQGCDSVPPPEGEFLELPAGGSFTVELAHNRAQTTLSYSGQFTSEWPDGQSHPEDWHGNLTSAGVEDCIQDDGAMHVQNQTAAAGTAFAISYESDISAVTMDNLAVFSVLEHTPWKRVSTYQVPNLPECPPGGCTCAWLWVPNGCGIPNMYMQGFKCNVTGATSSAPVAPAKAPVYCGNDSSKCVSGAKQMIAWNQASGVNVFPPQGVSPGYNAGMGWTAGAQSDIFGSASSTSSATSSASASMTSSVLSVLSTPTTTTSVLSVLSTPTTTSTSVSSTSSTMSTSSLPTLAHPASPSASSTTFASSTPSTSSLSTIIPPTSSSSSSFSSSWSTQSPSVPASSTIPTTLATQTSTANVAPPASTTTTPPSSSTASTPAGPTGTGAPANLFPEFVKWMEGAWAQWVQSHDGQV